MLARGLIRLNSFLMDYYVLIRMFKKIEDENYSSMDKIICYFGAAHTINIAKFLRQYLDFDMKIYENYYPHKSRCLDITNLKMPLFS